MAIRFLRSLTAPERNVRANRHLGYSLAFNAGAVNAGGFLAVGRYTSHMTGILSSMADNLVLGALTEVITAFVALLSFVAGAMISTLLINWGRRRRLRSMYALALMFEAALLLVFGLLGSQLQKNVALYTPITVMILCVIMGCQNAMITKLSGAIIRTTHMTGIVTDMGIELGKLFYWNRSQANEHLVKANREKLHLHSLLLLMFTSGALAGVYAFKYYGYISTVPLALWLLAKCIVPAFDDAQHFLPQNNTKNVHPR